jgi:hypothetical protein
MTQSVDFFVHSYFKPPPGFREGFFICLFLDALSIGPIKQFEFKDGISTVFFKAEIMYQV